MRVAVITSRATSLMNVARDIAFVIQQRGHVPVLLDYMPYTHDLARQVDQVIVVMTFNPLMSRTWFLLQRELLKLGIPTIVYTTIEGKPVDRYISPWIKRETFYVANSRYTARNLSMYGLQVIDIVYHGVNFNTINAVKPRKQHYRKYIESKLGQGVIYGIVASNHPRKGLKEFSGVVAQVVEKCDECKFYILSTPGATGYFSNIKNVYVDPRFGKLMYEEVLGLIAAFDYYVQPSLAEGFCLPVLEANALGVPAIHLEYEPITEYSRSDFNFYVKYNSIVYDDLNEGIYYEMHYYEPSDFIDTILYTYDIIVNKKDEYRERSVKAVENAKNYSVDKLYPRLLEILDKLKG